MFQRLERIGKAFRERGLAGSIRTSEASAQPYAGNPKLTVLDLSATGAKGAANRSESRNGCASGGSVHWRPDGRGTSASDHSSRLFSAESASSRVSKRPSYGGLTGRSSTSRKWILSMQPCVIRGRPRH